MDLNLWRGNRKGPLAAVFMVALIAAPFVQAQAKREVKVLTLGTDGAYLGIEMEDVTAENMSGYKLGTERGVIVRSVEKGSPAEAANLQEKDVILEYAGTPVFSSAQFSRMVRETPPGRKVDLVASREGKKLNLSAKIGQRESGNDALARNFRILPGEREEREFNFSGPDGRFFEFHMPGGPGNAFIAPKGSTGVFSVGKPRLGVELQSLSPQMAEFLGVSGKKGVLVTSVMENTPAVGNLKAGDVIIRADDRVIENPEDLTQLLSKKDSAAKVELKIVREKKEQTIIVELAKTDNSPKKGRGFSL